MVFLMGLLLAPFIVVKFGEGWVDGGWALGRVGFWLILGLIIWEGANLGIPINTNLGVLGGGGVMLLLLLWWSFRHRLEVRARLKQIWPLVLAEELLFLGGYLWLAWVRGHNGDILDLEKFMDHGLMATYLRSPTLPAMDMWLAGEKINYYTFGHFLGSVMVRVWGIDLAYAYNLLLAMLMGMGVMMAFSVTVNLIGNKDKKINFRRLILGGVVGSLLLNVAGNSHALWYFLANGGFINYWYADATRFIENTIHEFPSYSYIVSDLHAHLWGLPMVMAWLLVVMRFKKSLEKEGRSLIKIVGWSVGLGALMGVMAMTNTWDLLIYGLLLCILGLLLLLQRKARFTDLVMAAVVVVMVAAVVSSGWWLNFVSIDQGVRLVSKRSPLWQLLVLWSTHLLLTAMAIVSCVLFKNKKGRWQVKVSNSLVVAMGITAVILLLLPEVIYFKDIYPSHPRANTMFKLTYQAFMLMGLLGGWLVASLTGKVKTRAEAMVRAGGMSVVVLLIGGLLMFPYFGYRDYYGGLRVYKGLDGLSWIRGGDPDDYLMLGYLKSQVKGRPVILEAVGESYTEFARMSALSGLPTVLGWRVHEWLWRGGFEIPGKRTEEVRAMYETPLSKEAKSLYEKYQVKFVIIGNKERATYKLRGKDLEKLGKVVFRSNKSEIIGVD